MLRRYLGIICLLFALSPLSAFAQKKIELWHVFNLESDMIHGAIRNWNARNPGIQIDARIVPLAQINTEFTKAISSGSVPDVVLFGGESMAAYSSQNAFEDLTDLLKNSSVKFGDYYPGARAAGTWGGKIYGLPRAVNTLALYYNADMLAAKGVKPPSTWSEFSAAAAKLTEPGKVYGAAFSAIQSEEGTFQFLPWLYQAGGSPERLDTPEARAALQIWVDLVQKGYASKDVVTMRQYEATNTFISGNAAMVEGGPWELPRLEKDAKFKWGVTLLPMKDDKRIQASSLGDYMLTIPKGARNKAEAFKVIEYMQSDEVMATAWDSGRMPPRAGVKATSTKFAGELAVFQEQMRYAKVRGPHPQWPEISRPIQLAIQEALTGKASVNDALKKAAATLAPIFAKTPLPPQ
jgi:multiple sugar transport system substrate-binding protein